MPDTHRYAVILAGGSGQRFWPLSRELVPKQLLTVFNGESLIGQAVRRADGFVARSRTYIVTHERLLDEVRNHVAAHPEVGMRDVRFILEPLPRNTAPAIAYAAAVIERIDPDGLVAVFPSDHVLETGEAWSACLESAWELAKAGYIVTIGIEPTRPETAYGYIKAAEELSAFARAGVRPRRAERFVEKPEADVAAAFLADGSYVWNAGIFVMRASTVLDELASFDDVAGIADAARWLARSHDEGAFDPDRARERFAALPCVSIDRAVMERSEKVAVIPSALAWSDVGSLEALGDVAPPDSDGNVRVGRGVDIGSARSIVYATDRLVATLGVEDLLVIDSADATLVARRDRAQDVRLVVEALMASGAEEAVKSRSAVRPWGSWTVLLSGPGYRIKLIVVKPGGRLSLQRHAHRSEHWVVVAGAAIVTSGSERLEVRVNESVYIPIGVAHRIENPGVAELKIIEVQVGEHLSEDDIVRIEDDWDRAG